MWPQCPGHPNLSRLHVAQLATQDRSETVLCRMQGRVTYRLSRIAPRAGSYRPPGTGFSSESKVVGFTILLTEIDRISSAGRKLKSTPVMDEATGCEIFMAPTGSRQGAVFKLAQLKRSSMGELSKI